MHGSAHVQPPSAGWPAGRPRRARTLHGPIVYRVTPSRQAHACRYFPSNVAHAILGLEEGCTYLAGYDQADFEEFNTSRGLSLWLTSNPPAIVAQARAAPCAGIAQPSVLQSLRSCWLVMARLEPAAASELRSPAGQSGSPVQQPAMCRRWGSRRLLRRRPWPSSATDSSPRCVHTAWASWGCGSVAKTAAPDVVQGDLAELTRGQAEPPLLAAKAAPLQPPHATPQFHRLALDAMIAPEVSCLRPECGAHRDRHLRALRLRRRHQALLVVCCKRPFKLNRQRAACPYLGSCTVAGALPPRRALLPAR